MQQLCFESNSLNKSIATIDQQTESLTNIDRPVGYINQVTWDWRICLESPQL